jgi:hypothetical protein
MTDIQTYLQNLKVELENSLVNFQNDYNGIPQSEVQALADINSILDSGGSSTGITEGQVTSAIEAADLSAIASQTTLEDVLTTLATGLSVNTELPTAITIADNLSPSSQMPFLASLGVLFNGSNLVRWRATSQALGEGLGRAKVTGATEVINFILSTTTSGITPVINLGSVYSICSAQLKIVSGTITTISWRIEGSFDGTVFFDLETSSSNINGSAIHSSGKLFQYVRTNILSLTGVTPIFSIIGGAY